jgi:hypothetical protein
MMLRMARYAAPLILICCLFVPVRNRPIDGMMLVMAASAILGWIISVWRRPLWRSFFLVLALLFALPFVLPARAVSTTALQATYAQSLEKYLGVAYWWGGETSLGIDCSGLVRAGMMDACVREGLRTGNGMLFRFAFDLWWHDESAGALGDGYRALTVPVTITKSLNTLNPSALQKGDLAVAGDGVHILAYLGDHRWIQADPIAGKVVITRTPSDSPWMMGAAKIVRWTLVTADQREANSVEFH